MPIYKIAFARTADSQPIRVDTFVSDRLADAVGHAKANFSDVWNKAPHEKPEGFSISTEVGVVVWPFQSVEAH